MAFEFNQTNLTNQKKVAVCQFGVTSKFMATGDEQVKKVLRVEASPKINSCEQIADGCSFAGTTFVNIAYVGESGEIASIKGQFEWQNKCDNIDLVDLKLIPQIEDIECKVQEDGVTLSALINVYALGTTQIEVKELVAGDDLVTKTETKTVKSVAATGSEEFNIVEDFAVSADIEEILTVGSKLAIKSVTAGVDSVTVEGICIVNAVAKTADGITNFAKDFDFKQEIACFGANIGQTANAYLNAFNSSIVLNNGDDEGNNATASLTVGVVGNVCTYAESEVTVALDAFSCACDTCISRTCESFDVVAENAFLNDNVVCNISIENYANFDEIKSVMAGETHISSMVQNGDKTDIEGVVEVDVIYSQAEGQIERKCELVPFSISAHGNFGEAESVSSQISSFKIRGTHELEVIVNVYINAKRVENFYLDFVSNIELGENEICEEAGILMYVAKENEDLFDVSRALKVKPEQIVAQNDNLESISANDKIFVYLPQTADF